MEQSETFAFVKKPLDPKSHDTVIAEVNAGIYFL